MLDKKLDILYWKINKYLHYLFNLLCLVETRKLSLPKTSSKLGMRAMVDTIQSDTPRPKSPKMNNEEPIVLAHYPGARRPDQGSMSRIERDDFPAPPYPYTDPGE